MRDFSQGVAQLSLNTATLRKQLDLPGIVEACARRGIRTICPWRDQVAAAGLQNVVRQLAQTGIGLSGYCRGGFFPAADTAGLVMLTVWTVAAAVAAVWAYRRDEGRRFA